MKNIRFSTLLCLFAGFFLMTACSPQKRFKSALAQLKKGNEKRAERKFSRLKENDKVGLGAQTMLLSMSARRTKDLNSLIALDGEFVELGKKYDRLNTKEALTLKKLKAGKGALVARQSALHRRICRSVEKKGSVLLLDSINELVRWTHKSKPNWDTARAHVVAQNMRTHDYDTITAILTKHLDVVSEGHKWEIWRMRDQLWRYFLNKYDYCDLKKFTAEHPKHNLSYDCWEDEAAKAFCAKDIETKIEFVEKYPYSAWEFSMVWHIANMRLREAASEKAISRKREMQDYAKLIQIFDDCRESKDAAIWDDFDRYVVDFAPRLSAYLLLVKGTSYLFHNNESAKAKEILEKARPFFPDSSVCRRANYDFQVDKIPVIDSCLSSLSHPIENADFRPMKGLNTIASEFVAVSWDEGEEVYFTRTKKNKTKGGFYTIMMAQKRNGKWEDIREVPELTLGGKAVAQSITLDGRQILLLAGRKIFIAQRENETKPWNPPVYIPTKLKGIQRAVFSPDGKAIVIQAIAQKSSIYSKTNTDLYYLLLDEKVSRFRQPVPFGENINTVGEEANPYLCSDGVTMYFSSNGLDGYGGNDVFVTRKLGSNWDTWSTPENIGCQFNTIHDDYPYSWVSEDGKTAFFTQKADCQKTFDLFSAQVPVKYRPKPSSYLRGQVTNKLGNAIGRGHIEIRVNQGSSVIKEPISPTGKFRFRVPDTVWHVDIYPDIKGYYALRDTSYDLRNRPKGFLLRDTFVMLTALEAEKKGIELKFANRGNVNMSARESPSYRELYRLSRFVKSMRSKITITAHAGTGETGAASTTQKSADAIKNILCDKFRLNPDSVIAVGKGSAQLKCPDKPKDQACNNRVEVYFQFYKPVENKGTGVSRRQLPPTSPPAVADFTKGYAGEKGEEGDEPAPKSPALKAREAEKEKKDNLIVKVWKTITFEKARKRKREIRREERLIDKEANW